MRTASRSVPVWLFAAALWLAANHGRAAEGNGGVRRGAPRRATRAAQAAPARKTTVRASATPTVQYDHGDPTDEEQWVLEMINRARADPDAEGARLGLSDIREGLAFPAFVQVRPPLAFNPLLIAAARGHSQDMYNDDFFDHINPNTTKGPGERVTDTGYGWTVVGENLAALPAASNPTAADLEDILMIDAFVPNRDHRVNLLDIYASLEFREIGLGFFDFGTNNGAGFSAVMTQNFASRADPDAQAFLVGVLYNDANGNGFYDPGEGLPGVTVMPDDGTYFAVTSSSGGYAIPITTTGALTVNMYGGPLTPWIITKNVTVDATGPSIKLDGEIAEAVGIGGTFEFTAATSSVIESGGVATFTVTRSGGAVTAVSLDYAISAGSATAGSDYIGSATGTLFWVNGNMSSRIINLTIVDDIVDEANETVTLTLGAITGGGVLGTQTSSTLTIIDNEYGVVNFSQSAYSWVEETAGTVTLTITRTGGGDGDVDVLVTATDLSAGLGFDYTFTATTVSWADGDMTDRTVTLTVLDDSFEEFDDQLQLDLAVTAGNATLGPDSSVIGTIVDNVDEAGVVDFSAAAYTVKEPDGTATITATRSAGSDGPISVGVGTADGTAVSASDEDYTALNGATGLLSWADGESGPKSLTISITDDGIIEGDETVLLWLTFISGAFISGTTTNALLTIVDDDDPGVLTLDATAYSVDEDLGPLILTVRRIGGTKGAATVDVILTGVTATSGTDYLDNMVALTWADGNGGDRFVFVPVLDDFAIESDETFTVALVNAAGAALGVPNTAVATIYDNEVDTIPPSAWVAVPLDGDIVTGEIKIDGIAFDNVGVAEVRVRIDGDPVGVVAVLGAYGVPTTGFAILWDTAPLPNGTHTVTIEVTDVRGLTTSSAFTITVTTDNIVTLIGVNGEGGCGAPSAGTTVLPWGAALPYLLLGTLILWRRRRRTMSALGGGLPIALAAGLLAGCGAAARRSAPPAPDPALLRPAVAGDRREPGVSITTKRARRAAPGGTPALRTVADHSRPYLPSETRKGAVAGLRGGWMAFAEGDVRDMEDRPVAGLYVRLFRRQPLMLEIGVDVAGDSDELSDRRLFAGHGNLLLFPVRGFPWYLHGGGGGIREEYDDETFSTVFVEGGTGLAVKAGVELDFRVSYWHLFESENVQSALLFSLGIGY